MREDDGSNSPDRSPPSHSSLGEPQDSPAARILVIEDNADSRDMLKALLELQGHQVQVAEDGVKGLDALRRDSFDVALIDIGLPGMDGYQVARKAREERKGSTRLVALTGYGRSTDREAVREAGFDEHLVKPLKLEELSRVLRHPR